MSSQSALGARLHAACACASSRRFTPPGTERKYERSRPFQIEHLSLDLDVDLATKSVSGTAELLIARRASQGKEISLDAAGLQIKSVKIAETNARLAELTMGDEYTYDGDELIVSIPQEFDGGRIVIEYRAVPRLGLYFLKPDKEVPNRPVQVWSQCQDEDGRHWFPCQDKPHVKMTYELRARVPQGMTVLSGGELVEAKRPKKGRWEFHHRLDVATPAYLITLVVGQFDEWTEDLVLPSGKSVPLRYLVPPGRVADGKRAFHRTGEAIALFSERTGVDYPFDRYSQVVVSDFIFGGMENTTATTMYEHILFDKRAAIDVDSYDLVAHELAHQWFGDLVTCRDWSHAWLNEGFATYFEHVEREHRLGLDEYEQNVTSDLNVYLQEARSDYQRPIVCRDYEEPIDLFDRHLYQKGGLVLHMLRNRLGDACFWEGVKSYLNRHRGGIVETNDLMRAFEEVSGLSLEKFFDQWVYRPGHPDLKVKVSYGSGVLTVDVEQRQKGPETATFELPFEIDVEIEGATTRHRRVITEKTSSIVVRTAVRPSLVTVDPDYLLTAPMQLIAPADLLRNLLTKGVRARARRMAAMALGKRQDPDTVDALIASLNDKSELWMVRSKSADSLGKIRGELAEAALIKGVKIGDPKVRRAVASALGALASAPAAKALMILTKDESYLVTAAAARALGRCRGVDVVGTLKALLKKNSWSEVVRASALAGLAEAGEETELSHLLDWSKYGKPLRARRAAIAALPRLGAGKKVRAHLVDMLSDRDPHIRAAVLSSLGTLGEPQAKGAIHELLESELDGGVRTRAREVLSELGKPENAGIKDARDDNQRLGREVTELKTRLARLEQLMEQGEGVKKVAVKKTAVKKAAVKKAAVKKAAVKTAAPKKMKANRGAPTKKSGRKS